MAEVDEEYLYIYSKNPQVQLVILYGDDGQITGDKYKANRIKGRAILWECVVNGQKSMFMDRIYTTFDSDVELFKQFAQKNGWYYKDSQSMTPRETITDGTSSGRWSLSVQLNDADWSYYPYVDTLCFCYPEENLLSNEQDEDKDMRVLRSTEGEWYSEY
jgi:hypothetical protein